MRPKTPLEFEFFFEILFFPDPVFFAKATQVSGHFVILQQNLFDNIGREKSLEWASSEPGFRP